MRNYSAILCFLAAMIFPAVNPAAAQSSGTSQPSKVFVSILPQAYFVERIGGPNVEVKVMVEPGQDAHTYEPTPKKMIELAYAKAFFLIGVPFEAKISKRLESTFKNLRMVDTTKGIKLRNIEEAEEHGHHDDKHGKHEEGHHHEKGEADPHVWLDPNLVKIQAATIAEALSSLDPAHAPEYAKNLKEFQAELDSLDTLLAKSLESVKGKEFFVFHPAYGYFADAYGLKQVPVEIEGKEPSARNLAALIKHAREEGVKVIFVQPQFSSKSAETIAEAINGVVVSLDPLAKDYLSNMKEMAVKIRAALKPEKAN